MLLPPHSSRGRASIRRPFYDLKKGSLAITYHSIVNNMEVQYFFVRLNLLDLI